MENAWPALPVNGVSSALSPPSQDHFTAGSPSRGRFGSLARSKQHVYRTTLPSAFFLSALSPDATMPNALIYLGYVGGVNIAIGLFVLGIGLVRKPESEI